MITSKDKDRDRTLLVRIRGPRGIPAATLNTQLILQARVMVPPMRGDTAAIPVLVLAATALPATSPRPAMVRR